MRLLVSAFADATAAAGSLLVLDHERVLARADVAANLRGLAWARDRVVAVDATGLLWHVTPDPLGVVPWVRVPGALDAHDLVPCLSEHLAIVSSDRASLTVLRVCGRLEHVIRPWLWGAENTPANGDGPGDAHHLNSAIEDRGNWLLSVLSIRAKAAHQRWGDLRLDDGALIHWGPHGFLWPVHRRGLEQPHSLRRHAGRLWWVESGAGLLVAEDGATWSVPGRPRGLAFDGAIAAVGISAERRGPKSGSAAVALFDTSLLGSEPRTIPLPADLREVFDVLAIE